MSDSEVFFSFGVGFLLGIMTGIYFTASVFKTDLNRFKDAAVERGAAKYVVKAPEVAGRAPTVEFEWIEEGKQ